MHRQNPPILVLLVLATLWPPPPVESCGHEGEPEVAKPSGRERLPAGLLLAAQEANGAWGVPQQVGPPVNTTGNDCAPAINLRGDRLYFEREIEEDGGKNDIFVSMRTDTGWTVPERLPETINSHEFSESKPAISPGGDSLFFSKRDDIYISVREGSSWSTAVPFADSINTIFGESSPYLSADGQEFYFTSDRPGGYGWSDMYVSTWNGSDWGQPVNLGPNVNTSDIEWYCCVSPDGSTLYFVTSRPGGYGNVDLWRSERTEEGWSLPTNLGGTANGSGPACRPSITQDGRTLYFGGARHGEGEGGLDIWTTTWQEGIQ